MFISRPANIYSVLVVTAEDFTRQAASFPLFQGPLKSADEADFSQTTRKSLHNHAGHPVRIHKKSLRHPLTGRLTFPLPSLTACLQLVIRFRFAHYLTQSCPSHVRSTGEYTITFTMATSTSPKIAAANIPSITTLRNDLNYGDPRLPRCAAFYDDTRAFRKKFVTSHGVAGIDLHDWRSRDGQAGLTEMTVAYLDKEGNGPMFWPDDKSSSKYNRYQYSKDHER